MSTTPSELDQILAETPEDVDVYVSMIFDLAEQVKADIEAQGINRRELAQRLGKTEPEVSRWLSGLHNLTMQSVAKLATALQLDLFTTRLNPLGYFGRKQQQVNAFAIEIPEVILANPPFESKPKSTESTMTRFTATVQTPEGERQTSYAYAA
jgi:transcriptional regulator with XRE-family HTH domain